jgi:catechol 2,3-dioxygenase-like lactoylglutathione lyase family enzyme
MSAQFSRSCFVLAVHDVERSARHYVDVLGFSSVSIDAPGWRFVERGPVRFDMGECPSVPSATEIGDHSYLARIFVDDVDAYHREISPRGATILSGPADKPWGLREMAVRTIDGHRIMFCTPVPAR